MASRSELFKRYFKNLDIYTEIDKKSLQEIFVRKIKKKVEKSNKFLRHVYYEKNIRIVDKTHQFYHEYSSLKLGTKNWVETLSKSFRSYIGWYLFNKDVFERSHSSDVKGYIYDRVFNQCRSIVLRNFYDEYLDFDNEVKASVLEEFYYNGKLEENYFEKLFRLYRYIIEEKKYDMLNEDGSINPEFILDFCIMGEKIPSSLAEKIRVSVGRTKENFDAYAKANCDKFKYFITLTFADKKEKEKHSKLNKMRDLKNEYDLNFIYIDDIKSLKECNKAFANSFRYLKSLLKKDNLDLYYLGCPEYHANGNVHYHFLFSDIPDNYFYDMPKWLDYDNVTKTYLNGRGLKAWRYGKSDVQLIKDEYKVTSYIAKYIEKSLNEIDGTKYFDRLNKKRYFASANLSKPIISYDIREDEEIDFNSVYIKERKSSFNENEIIDILYSL